MLNITSYAKAVADANTAAATYYEGKIDSDLTDDQYDDLLDGIAAFEAAHPADVITHSLFTAVAAGTSGGDAEHTVPMLSLDKANDIAKVARFLSNVKSAVSLEPKIDGSAISLHYVNGSLTQAITRGDGHKGEDITDKVRRQPIAGLLLNADFGDKSVVEIRGEVYMSNSDFATASTNRVTSGKEEFSNPRNAASGVLRRDTVSYVAPLSFAAYDVVVINTNKEVTNLHSTSHVQRMGALDAAGFVIASALSPEYFALSNDIAAQINAFGAAREKGLDYPTDGVVLKVDDSAERVKFGSSSRHPKWALAYKYPDSTVPSVLREVIYNVGRTGRLSLTGRIDPVEIEDTIVTYVSLHNVDWMVNKDARVGDTLRMKKANGVIPQVDSVDLEMRPKDSVAWIAPAVCPQCGESFNKDTLLWRCESPSCAILNRVLYAFSRDALDVEGFSTALATILVESGRVNSIADLFTLSLEDLANLDMGRLRNDGSVITLGVKTATKIIDGIEKAKFAPFARVVVSLGLLQTGRGISKRLAEKFKTMDALLVASVEELRETEAVGKEKSAVIHSELRKARPVIAALAVAGVNMQLRDSEKVVVKTISVFSGKKVCVSGTIPNMSRNEAQDAAVKLGAKISTSISKNTDLLITGDGAGSKLSKAKGLGVAVMTADEFLSITLVNL